jgi:hypothetical protein
MGNPGKQRLRAAIKAQAKLSSQQAVKKETRPEMVEQSDGWSIGLQEWTVTQCQVDCAFSLTFQAENNEFAHIRIEQPFDLWSADQHWQLSAADDPTALGPALGLLHQTVRFAHVSTSGILELEFSSMRLHAPPDPHGNYEAWSISGVNGTAMVCLPSGGLAVW